MDIGLHENIDTPDTIELYLFIFVLPPITHPGHVCTASVILLVTLSEDDVLIKGSCKPPAFVGLDPRIVVKSTFNVSIVLVSVKPDICRESALSSLNYGTHTRHKYVLVMGHEVFDNLLGAVHDIYVSPIYPGMFWLQR